MITIRSMKENDAGIIAKLEKECFTLPWSEQALIDSLKQKTPVFLLAQEEEEILGYVGMYVSYDEGEITNVAVFPAARRRHVASLLLEKLHETAGQRGITSIFLEVRVSNEAAISLYKGLGYQILSTRKGLYDQPKEDGFLMKKEL